MLVAQIEIDNNFACGLSPKDFLRKYIFQNVLGEPLLKKNDNGTYDAQYVTDSAIIKLKGLEQI